MLNPVLLQHLATTPAAQNPMTNPKVFLALPPAAQAAVQVHAPAASAMSGGMLKPVGPAANISAGLSAMSGGVQVGGSLGTTTQTGLVSTLAQNAAAAAAATTAAAAGVAPGSPGPGSGAANDPGTWAGPAPTNPYGYEGWEIDMKLNPVSGLKRKPWPVHILPGSATTDANGNATITLTPQEDFQAFLMTMPSVITSQGYVTQIVVGTRVVNVASGKMPIECFSEKNDGRRIDFPFAKATQQISITIAGAPATTLLYVVLVGYAPGAPGYANTSAAARMGTLPLGTTLIAASTTTNPITVTPQERFKLRRLLLNSQALNFGSLLITTIQIGTRVESAQSSSFPAAVFSDLAIDDWVDFDVCSKNTQIAITVQNTNTTQSAVFEGFGVGDVWYDDELGVAA